MSKKKPKPPTDWCDVVTCTCGTVMRVSDYTPTKLEVRSQYAQEAFGADEYIKAIAEFDRWLEAHNAEVVKETEERIIKLLEDNNKLCTEKTVCFDADDGWLCNCKELFALIKGEQK